jgi:hypothetical protein
VVNLREYRKAVLRQIDKAVELFDQVELPERSRHVERSRVDAGGLNTELPPVAWLRQRDMAHVIFEIEAFILDPVGMIEVQRHTQKLLAKNRREMQAAFNVAQQSLESHPAFRRSRWVIDVDERDIRIRFAAVSIDKAGIFTVQLAHTSKLLSPCGMRMGRV